MKHSTGSIVRTGILALTLIAGAPVRGASQDLWRIATREAVPPVAGDSPTPYAARWQAAREEDNLGAAEADKETRKEVLRRALEHAQGAKDLEPDGIDGRYWLAVASGLLAEDEGGRAKIRLAEQAWDESGWILGGDSLHAGAHHLQGRLHAA